MRFIRPSALCLLLLLALACAEAAARAAPTQVSVAAAISLKESLDEIAKAYESASAVHVAITYGASGQLLAQIKAGAPVDIFFSAAPEQLDELDGAKLMVAGSRRVVVRNQLVLIVPRGRDAKDPP